MSARRSCYGGEPKAAVGGGPTLRQPFGLRNVGRSPFEDPLVSAATGGGCTGWGPVRRRLLQLTAVKTDSPREPGVLLAQYID
jgi:hypothetical protein